MLARLDRPDFMKEVFRVLTMIFMDIVNDGEKIDEVMTGVGGCRIRVDWKTIEVLLGRNWQDISGKPNLQTSSTGQGGWHLVTDLMNQR